MQKALLILAMMPVLSLAVPKKSAVKTERVEGKLAAARFLKWLPVGEYKGQVPGKKTKCAVEAIKTDSYFEVLVDDLTTSIHLATPCDLRQSKTSIALTDYEEDGDEHFGSYLFTRTARVTKLENAVLKVSVIEQKDFLDTDMDTETAIRACNIKLR